MWPRSVCLLVAMTVVSGNPASAQLLTVQTTSGTVRGDGTGVAVFKGIPYAAPPTGEQRWRPPAAPPSWTSVRDATRFGPQCPQQGNFAPRAADGLATTAPGILASEDCLTLNVWTPATSNRERLPVMVWIHGGGFTIGSGASPRSSGEMLARLGVVVVTINYRLGALGFFAHPDLSRESARHVSGNYGLLDQIAALRWVRENIAAFGGNPANVTVFGQSAGASSGAGALMVSPLARGLFHRVIAQSAGTTGTVGPKPRLAASYYGFPAAEAKGRSLAADIATLRALTADEVLAKLPNTPTLSTDWHFGPVIDGYVLPDDPGVLLGTGAQAKVPLLIGYNADEANFYRNESPRSVATYREFLGKLFPGALAETVLARYAATDDATSATAALRMFSDFRFITPTVLTARLAATAAQVYVYKFARVSPLNQATFGGAAHGTEIPYIFGHITANDADYQAVDRTLSRAMAGAWVQFATTGTPNGPSLPEWPAYTAPGYRLLEYGNAISVQANPDRAAIEFFGHTIDAMRRNPASPVPQ